MSVIQKTTKSDGTSTERQVNVSPARGLMGFRRNARKRVNLRCRNVSDSNITSIRAKMRIGNSNCDERAVKNTQEQNKKLV